MSSLIAKSKSASEDPIDTARGTGETRAHQRHLTIMRVAKFVADGREGLGVVRNLSASGMKIDTYVGMEIGQPITVSLSDGHHLDATIVWQRDDSIGIKFDRLASVAEMLAIPVKPGRGKLARPPRIATGQSALLHCKLRRPVKVEIADLSQRGAKIVTDAKLSVHDDVSLELTGLNPIAATVRWVRPGTAGLAFHTVLAIKPLMAWLSGQANKQSD